MAEEKRLREALGEYAEARLYADSDPESMMQWVRAFAQATLGPVAAQPIVQPIAESPEGESAPDSGPRPEHSGDTPRVASIENSGVASAKLSSPLAPHTDKAEVSKTPAMSASDDSGSESRPGMTARGRAPNDSEKRQHGWGCNESCCTVSDEPEEGPSDD